MLVAILAGCAGEYAEFDKGSCTAAEASAAELERVSGAAKAGRTQFTVGQVDTTLAKVLIANEECFDAARVRAAREYLSSGA